jgi:haloalkane dehalogenase
MKPDIRLSTVAVLDSQMAYREGGRADVPIALFLHGNPTSSYIWRNILPAVAEVAHCIAPDLIGFGQSGKPDIPYRFEDHVRYLDAFLADRLITSAYLVAQDWGTALAFHLAARKPNFVRGLAFMEFTRPVSTWKEFLNNSTEREIFRKFRTPGEGEKLILEQNLFVEGVLPGGTLRKFTEEEMAVYRAPFTTPESRRPTWRFPNELPIAGEPADVYSTMEKAHAALAAAMYPKLLFAGDPGALVPTSVAEDFARKLHNCRLVKLGSGLHYLQEDHPEIIGREVAAFIAESEARNKREARITIDL